MKPRLSPPFDTTTTPHWWLLAAQCFDGQRMHRDVALRVAHGQIAQWGGVDDAHPAGTSGLPSWQVQGMVAPGYFDIQVNGGAGWMFNNTPTAEALQAIGTALRQHGTTAWLPTFITDSPERMRLAAQAIAQTHGRHGVVGVHFEGPHIAPERRGAHKAEFIRPLDDTTLGLVQELRNQHIPVLLTLAPECVPVGSVARLCAMGVVVSIGHTAALATQVNAALAEGASCFTHLFNAMTPLSSREPGVVGAALDSTAWCGVIADGHHVNDAVLRLALRARPRSDRMVVVSDAMATTHGPNQFELYGETIQVQDGRLVNQAGSLAGAHIDMAQSVRRLITQVGIAPEQALAMATHNPAQLMGLQDHVGGLAVGQAACGVVLDDDWAVAAVF